MFLCPTIAQTPWRQGPDHWLLLTFQHLAWCLKIIEGLQKIKTVEWKKIIGRKTIPMLHVSNWKYAPPLKKKNPSQGQIWLLRSGKSKVHATHSPFQALSSSWICLPAQKVLSSLLSFTLCGLSSGGRPVVVQKWQ